MQAKIPDGFGITKHARCGIMPRDSFRDFIDKELDWVLAVVSTVQGYKYIKQSSRFKLNDRSVDGSAQARWGKSSKPSSFHVNGCWILHLSIKQPLKDRASAE